jgi:uncharacterized protein YbjT (DUF2867 family)
MKVLIFGATGMVGQGVLRECLLASDVADVITIGRTGVGQEQPKLRDIVHADLFDLSSLADELAGADAVFFCLGVTSAGMTERAYRRITYDLTMSVAGLFAANPALAFVYVSGAGTDSTGRSRMMWARVKGETENALLAMPFRAYLFRPGFIQPLHGIRSNTRTYRVAYALLAPISPTLRRLFPRSVTTTEIIGRAMLAVARHGAPTRILGNADIAVLGGSGAIAGN